MPEAIPDPAPGAAGEPGPGGEASGGQASGGQARPVGWWLKEADRRLDRAFDRALEGFGSNRRSWQVLASLARQPQSRGLLVEHLAPFDPPAAVEAVIVELTGGGFVVEDAGLLRLTGEGAGLHAALSGPVGDVRRQVRGALPGGDYATLIRLLERLTAALPAPGTDP
jgi:hypothetical protein